MVALPFPLIAFGFGILSVLSPCILPLVPLIAAYSTRTSKITPLTVAIGLSISFALMGVLASIFGSIFQRYKLVLLIIGGLLIIFLGLCMIFELFWCWLGFISYIIRSQSTVFSSQAWIPPLLLLHLLPLLFSTPPSPSRSFSLCPLQMLYHREI